MQEDEKELTIDFNALWQVIKEGKWLILATGFLSALLAAVVLFQKPNEYTSTASVMPELESSSLGGLGKYAGLASLAGINLGDMASSDAIRPDLYPNVINNTTFFLYLLKQNVRTSDGKVINFKKFYYEVYEVENDTLTGGNKGIIEGLRSLLGIAKKTPTAQKDSDGQVIYITKTEGEVIEELMQKITANMDKKTGIISISAELSDPVTAAHVAQLTMNYLTEFVTNYRTEKARHDVDFLAQRLSEAKGKYYSTQSKKAQYNDQFQVGTIRLQAADIQRERIESDYRLNSSFYQELLKQYETAKLKVQQETPVFKTLQQPVVPYEKSGPRRLVTIILLGIVGLVIGVFTFLIKKGTYKTVFLYK